MYYFEILIPFQIHLHQRNTVSSGNLMQKALGRWASHYFLCFSVFPCLCSCVFSCHFSPISLEHRTRLLVVYWQHTEALGSVTAGRFGKRCLVETETRRRRARHRQDGTVIVLPPLLFYIWSSWIEGSALSVKMKINVFVDVSWMEPLWMK